MDKRPDAGWTLEQWEQLGEALRTPAQRRTVAQDRMVMYFREGRAFRTVEDVWNWRARGCK